ncbi:ion channel [Pantanalinema rosaneae CENA516]|uniref:ion channel n=1 Tax=Pantanalinema rosaneae TaxID=1620701 RepID=UPI003D6E8C8A
MGKLGSNPEARTRTASTRLYQRVVKFGGSVEFVLQGLLHPPWRDLYHLLLKMSWGGFISLIVVAYLMGNTLFALAYLAGGDCIANAQPGSFPDAFFFSVQTMATIGYGAMYPKTSYANILVAIEALVGLLGVALATGLMFARFSRPTARVLFSQVAIVTPLNRIPTLMFRAANQRGNQILEARLWVTLIREETLPEGYTMRRIYDLNLTRNHTPFFALSWSAMHPIDPASPLYGETPASLAESHAEILVTLVGTDETVSQSIHARHSYPVHSILWNYRFVDIFHRAPDGRQSINYALFHDVVPLDEEL